MDERKISSSICRRCGRPLKDAYSRERGYGPECWSKLIHEGRKKLFNIRRKDDTK